ncbi:MAG: hypothetical protein U5Q03_14610 [Bacteroidota bacterium]|nr:hypothetical protein [Bacteroidota bacterium]
MKVHRAKRIFILFLLACIAMPPFAFAQLSLKTGNSNPFYQNTTNVLGLQEQEADPETSPEINRKRLRAVIITESTLFAASMIGLYQLWYKDYPQSSFHWDNDNNNWLQMDKVGHGVTSYYVGKIGYEALKWCNVDEKRSVWFGGTLGFVYLLTIETLDGFLQRMGSFCR